MPSPSIATAWRHRGRRSAPRLRSAVLAVLTLSATALALLPLGPLGPNTPAHAETIDSSVSTPDVVIAPEESVFLPSMNELGFTVTIRNPREVPLRAGVISLVLDQENVTAADELDRSALDAGVAVTTVPVESTEAEGEQTVTVTLSRSDLRVRSLSRGVHIASAVFSQDPGYLPAMRVLGSGSDIVSSTPFTIGGPEIGSIARVSAVIPLVLPDSVRTLPTRAQLEESVPRLEMLLEAALETRATLAIDPRVIAGVRAYGEAAPDSAVEFLDRLQGSGLPTFLLQFADADPAAQAALGFTVLLEAEEASFVTRFGEFDGAAAPSMDQLTAWPSALDRAWPSSGLVNDDTLHLLERSGQQSVVLSSSNFDTVSAPRARLGELDALIVDEGLRSAARDALSSESAGEQERAVAHLVAQLALTADDESSGRVLALDRRSTTENDGAALLLERLGELGWVDFVPEQSLATGPAEFASIDFPAEHAELLQASFDRSDAIVELAPLLEEPDYLIDYQRVRMLELLGTRYLEEGSDFEAVASRSRERDARMLRGVQVIANDQTQLVGSSSRLPVLIKNGLPFEASVTVTAAPTSAALSLPERELGPELVPPDGNTTVLVPVESRVSSGESGLIVDLWDANLEQVFHTSTLSVAISSIVERIAIVILGVLAAALLGFGVWRSFTRHRGASE